jgi:hypothetical protein
LVLAAPTILVAQPPHVASFAPTSGIAGTVVQVTGNGVAEGSVVWRHKNGTTHQLARSFAGAEVFSVPHNASPGENKFSIVNDMGSSTPMTFFVETGALPPPRIERISLLRTEFAAGETTADATLYIQAANVDVGASIVISGVSMKAMLHKVLRPNLYGISPASLGYPVHHHGTLVVDLVGATPGAFVEVAVANTNGSKSGKQTFKIPQSGATLDSDGDSLTDQVELQGFDANGDGQIEVNLATIGADPFRPDLFLELDVMTGLSFPPAPAQLNATGALELAVRVFAAAPIINPFADNGVHLEIDASQRIERYEVVGFREKHNTQTRVANFGELKRTFFTARRSGVFHYGVWGVAHPAGWSGESDVDFGGSGVGNDFIVTLEKFPATYQTLRSQVATLIHELGHNLGQRHGGDNHCRYKPNYWSAMSYTWQLRTGHDETFRREHPTCDPMYYADSGATETNGQLPSTINTLLDYSSGMGGELKEAALLESGGVCGIAIDWNHDGDIDATDVSSDIDGCPGTSVVRDYSNWGNLRFDGLQATGTSP